jgi:hypothetical protein
VPSSEDALPEASSSAQTDASSAVADQAALEELMKSPGKYTPDEVRRLGAIIRGDVSKKDLEIVLAQHDENIAWSDRYKHVRTLYCKGAATSSEEACIRLPNVGREGHTYLHHIVENYDNLANWTVFTQAGEPSVGYQGHRAGGGHMLNGIIFPDYMLNSRDISDGSDSFFVFTGAINLGTMHHYMRRGYKTVLTDLIDATDAANRAAAAATKAAAAANRAAATANAAARGATGNVELFARAGDNYDDDKTLRMTGASLRSKCPGAAEISALNEQDADESSRTGGWLWWPLGLVMDVLSERCSIPRSEIPKMAIQYWSQLDVPVPSTGMIFFAQGARFGVSRERIRQRPLEDYKKLLRAVTRNQDPCANYLNEWLWYYILGKPQQTKCDATPFGEGGSNEMYLVSETAQAYIAH